MKYRRLGIRFIPREVRKTFFAFLSQRDTAFWQPLAQINLLAAFTLSPFWNHPKQRLLNGRTTTDVTLGAYWTKKAIIDGDLVQRPCDAKNEPICQDNLRKTQNQYLIALLDHPRPHGRHSDARCVFHKQPRQRRPQIVPSLVPGFASVSLIVVLFSRSEPD